MIAEPGIRLDDKMFSKLELETGKPAGNTAAEVGWGSILQSQKHDAAC